MAYNKNELIQKIQSIETLSNEEKAALIELLRSHKKYGLVWEDKPEVVEERLRSELPILKEVKERAIISDELDAPNHILIEGDNLEALVALSYTHAGKVDVIYIDPPYNTGNKDFIYNDAYVDSEDSFRHSKWLSFIGRRLRLAKNLLSERGVIFISIDDNECSNLKLLCDEVFGESNFIATFPRLTTKSGKTPLTFMISNDYVLCYTKSRKDIFVGKDFVDASYKFEDEFVESRGRYNLKQPLDCNSISYSKSLDYPIVHEGITYYPGGSKKQFEERQAGNHLPKDYAWRWSKDLYQFGLKNGWIVFKNGRIYTKGYLNAIIEKSDSGQYQIEYISKTRKMSTIDFIDNEFSNDIAKKQLAKFQLKKKFDFPKPVGLIEQLVSSFYDKNCVVLDFFAGSATTFQSVIQLNGSDGGHRKCIIVSNNEGDICESVTYPRSQQVVKNNTNEKGVINNSLRFYLTDFVPRESSPKNMRALMAASTELLCIKNDLYAERDEIAGHILSKKHGRYFNDGKKQMLVIYNEEAIPEFAQVISSMDYSGKMLVYVFSPNNYPFEDEFVDVLDKVELCALPAAIYNAYLKVLPKKKKVSLPEGEEEASEQEEIENNGMLNLNYEEE